MISGRSAEQNIDNQFHFSDFRVNQDPAHEIAGLEYLFANKKDFGGDDNARQKLGSVLI